MSYVKERCEVKIYERKGRESIGMVIWARREKHGE
jgi:hypothetical protein